jgi:hypothetical protein
MFSGLVRLLVSLLLCSVKREEEEITMKKKKVSKEKTKLKK